MRGSAEGGPTTLCLREPGSPGVDSGCRDGVLLLVSGLRCGSGPGPRLSEEGSQDSLREQKTEASDDPEGPPGAPGALEQGDR